MSKEPLILDILLLLKGCMLTINFKENSSKYKQLSHWTSSQDHVLIGD